MLTLIEENVIRMFFFFSLRIRFIVTREKKIIQRMNEISYRSKRRNVEEKKMSRISFIIFIVFITSNFIGPSVKKSAERFRNCERNVRAQTRARVKRRAH